MSRLDLTNIGLEQVDSEVLFSNIFWKISAKLRKQLSSKDAVDSFVTGVQSLSRPA